MSGTNFAPGVLVSYRGHVGTIKFVDDSTDGYLTICVNTEGAMGAVCLVVYHYAWNEIELLKANR